MGKTRDLFKKIRDSKGTFHAKMGSIKDGNGMDLTEVEDIKKRCQEYTEELYTENYKTLMNGKEMQKSKMAARGGLTNSCENKRSEKQRRIGKI